MTQVIEIEGGLVRLVERTINYSVPMKDWLERIEKRNPITTPTLPVGTRALFWDPRDLSRQHFVVLIEQQPQIINMDYQGEQRRLSIPYSRFFFYASTNDPTNNTAWSLNNYRVFWSNQQYNSPTDTDMIAALLPNVYHDGRICFGSTGANANQTLAQRLNQTVNEFYVSRFNDDLTIRRPNGARTYREWMRMTENDPTGWMNWREWDVNAGYGGVYSYDILMSEIGLDRPDARFEPMLAADPIPDVPIGATFGRLNEWLEALPQAGRARLFEAVTRNQQANPDNFVAPPPEVDDDGEA
jgi:hypothetical protein